MKAKQKNGKKEHNSAYEKLRLKKICWLIVFRDKEKEEGRSESMRTFFIDMGKSGTQVV